MTLDPAHAITRRMIQAVIRTGRVIWTPKLTLVLLMDVHVVIVGFETLNSTNLQAANKRYHPLRDCRAAIRRLSDLGVMINASFVFGIDDDDTQDFQRTVDWALEMGVISVTFHILIPYPGTRLFARLKNEGCLLTENWSSYNTREVVFRPKNMSAEALKAGYDQAYRSFYQWGSIARSSMAHMDRPSHALRQFCYSAGWKKFEPFWSAAIKLKQLVVARPLLETLLMTHQKPQFIRPVRVTVCRRSRQTHPICRDSQASPLCVQACHPARQRCRR